MNVEPPKRPTKPPGSPDLPDAVLLDGQPGEPISSARGTRRALGRDPLAELDRDGLLDHALGQLQGAPQPATPERSGTALPRLDELGPPPDPATTPLGLGGIDARRLEALAHLAPTGCSVDDFGASPAAVRRALPPFLWVYRHWFRVRSEGHEHIPARGPVILVANHGGLLPFDGAMGIVDVLLKTDPPRLARALVARFVSKIPGLEATYERLGSVVGTRERFRQLLEADQAVLVFPEGVEGIRKPIAQRGRLQHFQPGFVRMALELGVPIVPVTFAGPDGQAPVLMDVKPLARRLGLPVFPITPTFPWLGPLGLLPYPVSYRIHYGEPIDWSDRHGPEDAKRPELVERLAGEVRCRIQQRLDRMR
ncbi:MAG: 1-acyl-sn-glycerol-3-phosphate acyltransferase [Myxococcota bacterium]|nr:1-acyl-sn-glycerol-3-phosphate acyltransferase [Myxococcota bacterium]